MTVLVRIACQAPGCPWRAIIVGPRVGQVDPEELRRSHEARKHPERAEAAVG